METKATIFSLYLPFQMEWKVKYNHFAKTNGIQGQAERKLHTNEVVRHYFIPIFSHWNKKIMMQKKRIFEGHDTMKVKRILFVELLRSLVIYGVCTLKSFKFNLQSNMKQDISGV